MLSDEVRERAKETLRDYIDRNCIFRCNPEHQYNELGSPGRLYSSSPSRDDMSWMFMLRRLTHDPQMLRMVSGLFLDDFVKRDLSFVQLGGLETSSLPLMTGLSILLGEWTQTKVSTFSIRKERKSYGLFNLIDGMPTEAPVIIMDDTINSGKTLSRCYDVCKYELNIIPAPVAYTIVRFRTDMEFVKWNDHEIEIVSLFDLKDFDLKYDPSKYWLPSDCDKSYNKRPEYR